MGRSISFILIASLNFSLASSLATCYDILGNAIPDIYTPCTVLTPFSMCWRSGDGGFGNTDSNCYPNGLSRNGDENTKGSYFRNGCTDPTWQSPYCLKAFHTCESTGFGNVQVTPCNGNGADTTNWCCGNNTDCCATSPIVIAATLGPVSSTTSLSSTISTTSQSKSSSTSTTTTPTGLSAGKESNTAVATVPNKDEDTGLSTGAKAGIGIGVGIIALVAIGALIMFAIQKLRKGRRDSSEIPLHDKPKGVEIPGITHMHEIGPGEHTSVHEAPGVMPYRDSPAELDSVMPRSLS